MIGRQVGEGDPSVGPTGGGKAHHGDRIVGGPRIGTVIQRAIVVEIVVSTRDGFARSADEEKRLRSADEGESIRVAPRIGPSSLGQAAKAGVCTSEPSRQRVDLVRAIELSDGQKAVGTEGQVGQIDQAMEMSGSAGDSAPAFYDDKVGAIGDCRIRGASEFDVLVLIAISKQRIVLDLADVHLRDAEG